MAEVAKALGYLASKNNNRPCVILLDLNLPGMNGVDFLKAAEADALLKNIPVVVLTASKEEQDIVGTFNLGIAGYIFKPVDSKKLEEFKTIKLYWNQG